VPAERDLSLTPAEPVGATACTALQLSPDRDFLLARPPLFGWSRVPFVRIDVRAGAGVLVSRTRYSPKDAPFLLTMSVVLAAWHPALAMMARPMNMLFAAAILVGVIVQNLRAPGAARTIRDAAARELRRRAEALVPTE
jgi:hypothetical protein